MGLPAGEPGNAVLPADGVKPSPIPARPPRPDRPLPPLRFMRALQANFVSVWPEDAYARPVTQARIGRRHLFTANDPSLVKHVLLDNASNYHKSPIIRRLLEPALGQGLVTSEGALWKRHRQLVARSGGGRNPDSRSI
jgi:cytochrome P450